MSWSDIYPDSLTDSPPPRRSGLLPADRPEPSAARKLLMVLFLGVVCAFAWFGFIQFCILFAQASGLMPLP